MAAGLEGFSDGNSAEDGNDHKKKWEASAEDFDDSAEDEEDDDDKPERKSIFERFGESSKEDDDEEAPKKRSIFAELLGDDDAAEDDPDVEEAKVDPLANVYLNPESTDDAESDPSSESVENEQFDAAVEQRIKQVDTEAASTEPSSVGEVIADAEFLASTRDKLHEGESPHAAIENAREEALENPIPDASAEEIDIELDAESGAEEVEIDLSDNDNEVDEDDPKTQPLPPPINTKQKQRQAPPPPPPLKPPVPTPPPPPPPPPPVPPVPPPPPPPPGGRPPVPPNPFYNPNAQQNVPPPAPIDTDPDDNENDYRRGAGPKIAAAGAVGYMLGRRGGRKRTEARLQPKIDEQSRALENQESDLDRLTKELEKAESEVRSAASVEAPDTSEAPAELPDAEAAAAKAKARAETMAAEKDEFARHEDAFERVIETKGVEEITKDMSATEMPPKSRVKTGEIPQSNDEDQPDKPNAEQKLESKSITDKAKTERYSPVERLNVNAMSQQQLLEVAAGIPMENHIGLRQLLEARRIDTKDMRRVVDAYLKGENYERILQNALDKGRYSEEKKHEIRKDGSDGGGVSGSGSSGSSSGSSTSPQSNQGGEQSSVANLSRGMPESKSAQSPLEQMARKVSEFDTSFADKPTLSNGIAALLGVVAGIIFIALVALLTDLL